jgi:hypothetical protein
MEDGEYTIFHTDNASIFNMANFANKYNILLSVGEQASHQNQAIERFNNTFRTYLRKTLISKLANSNNEHSIGKSSLNKLLKQASKTLNIEHTVHETVEFYNGKEHTSDRMFGMTPNHMDEALDAHKEDIPIEVKMAHNYNSPEALEIANIRAKVINKYAGIWLHFFIDWRHENKQETNRLYEQNKVLLEQNTLLLKGNELLEQNVNYLSNREKEREQKEREVEARKLRRQNAPKLQIRDAVEPNEFAHIISKAPRIYRDPITRARVICA